MEDLLDTDRHLTPRKHLIETCASTHMKSRMYDVKMNFLEIIYRELGGCNTVVQEVISNGLRLWCRDGARRMARNPPLAHYWVFHFLQGTVWKIASVRC